MINMLVAFVIGILLGALAMYAHLKGIYKDVGGK